MELPRVSAILKILDDSYAGVPQAALAYAAERGERLHRLCLSYLAGMPLSDASTRDEDAPAFTSFVRWFRDHAVESIAVEETAMNVAHGYQGTPDALVLIDGEEVLIDLKFTASILRINRVQIQAYRELDLYKTAKKAMVIHINPTTGTLQVHVVKKSQRDLAAFLNALSVWKWRES